MNYEETLDYINSITWIGSKLGLDRIRDLLDLLGNPQKKLKFIHIGGTNGKGSTAAMLSSILTEAGYKTGLFTSPYIESYNERIQINNSPISNEELAEITTAIKPLAESLQDAPTEFELNTAIGMEYFMRNQCDIVILEVGMGGLLDSTNVIDSPELAIITAIGLDHVKELGGTLEAIAKTKSGIIKEGCSVVAYGQDEVIEKIIKEECFIKNANYFEPEYDEIKLVNRTIGKQNFSYKEMKNLSIPLVGVYQLNNAAVVLKSIEVLRNLGWNIEESAVYRGLENTSWPGRFEIIAKNPTFIVDGAHNPQGIRATVESLKKYFDEKIVFLIGVMADKDVKDMVSVISPLAKEVVTVSPNNPRAMPSEELKNLVTKEGIIATACTDIAQGIEKAISIAGNKGVVCAIGSLYMIGDIKIHIKQNNK